MSKSAKNIRTASRPPVDALQYEKLALSAFGLIERQIDRLEKLTTLASSIYRNPAITREERSHHRSLLGLLIETAEDYQREIEIDRDLYQIIALDAKGIPQSRITARHAADLLAKAAPGAVGDRKSRGAAKAMHNKPVGFRTVSRRTATTH
ncbi:hypothetical protein A6V36_06085 [Paraburkholderia ginsengiterrae]|uniref:Uncharacterized protein n=1 Tax=Paraburkholderia ginsengiterrae TaxID=1462993 RepID=A0A1A9NGT3_9BURK|nr:hypothetical protein [Paraburkholderia ginsengiterrae]OAJ58488.1 hypothetical protein A6V36_06085 [Paraburkholderia ginsengiterrae]OAJ65707.1 hypothetical protein A6V37_14105 [Paraburkholderia ginsengiterrae]